MVQDYMIVRVAVILEDTLDEVCIRALELQTPFTVSAPAANDRTIRGNTRRDRKSCATSTQKHSSDLLNIYLHLCRYMLRDEIYFALSVLCWSRGRASKVGEVFRA